MARRASGSWRRPPPAGRSSPLRGGFAPRTSRLAIANGQLTFAGASQTLSLLRPGAQLDGMEMDEDDGFLLYEGDAYLDGQEYEFELDAHTGRLLEWERD